MKPNSWSPLQTYPDMREGGIQRFFAVHPKSLRDNCDDGHKNAHHTVLKHPDPNNLYNDQFPGTPQHLPKSIILH